MLVWKAALVVSLSLLLLHAELTHAQIENPCTGLTYLNYTSGECLELSPGFDLQLDRTEYNIVYTSDNDLPTGTSLFTFSVFVENGISGNIILITGHSEINFLEFGGNTGVISIGAPLENVTVYTYTIVSGADTLSRMLQVGESYSSYIGITNSLPPQFQQYPVNLQIVPMPDPCGGIECGDGTCTNGVCVCPPGYTGTGCTTELDPCDSSPCQFNGTCNTTSPVSFTCECAPGYNGSDCSENIDDCVDVDCGFGSCVDLVNNYTCICNAGYTGDNCTIDIDECSPNPCQNGICTDEINDYSCSCYFDWTGTNCETDIDACDSDPCDLEGSLRCNNANGTFECLCRPGYTDPQCSFDIDDCNPNPCQHNGSCTDRVNDFSCGCSFGYSGDMCEMVVDFCADNPCVHGTCNSTEAVGYECSCTPGFTGVNCGVDINECDPDPCLNGTCHNLLNAYYCECTLDYTGVNCETEINNCVDMPCAAGATCNDLNGTFTCDCAPDTTGRLCNITIDDCVNHTCQNGDCIDTVNDYYCSCYMDWTGANCETEIDSCDPNPCNLIGSYNCSDGNGTFDCLCRPGYTGPECGVNIDECDPNPCQNNGTCSDGIDSFNCSCPYGYHGNTCENEVDFCADGPCQNGGTCTSIPGVGYQCNCTDEYTGVNCTEEISACNAFSPCENNSTCVDGSGLTHTCLCSFGYIGQNCSQIDVDCQRFNPCVRGTCIGVHSGPIFLYYMCHCPLGFNGTNCTEDVSICQEEAPCENGGTCEDGVGPEYNCTCLDGFRGDNCTEDIDDYCTDTFCLHGGTCMEGYGTNIYCQCTVDFTGPQCETEMLFCQENMCLNNGTCRELPGGSETMCQCADGFNGTLCENDIEVCTIPPPKCVNGDCIDGIGSDYRCECFEGYSGLNCSIDDDHCNGTHCLNGGTCEEGEGPAVSCNCINGFAGDRCEIDVDFCILTPCQHNGTCIEGIGAAYTCNCTETYTGSNCETAICPPNYCGPEANGNCTIESNVVVCVCSAGYTGSRCEIDEEFCDSDTCQGRGECIEGPGDQYACVCDTGFTGNNCETDIEVCGTLQNCNNRGNCTDGLGLNYTCSCNAGFTGNDCETDIEVCGTLQNCNNRGDCTDGIGLDYTCSCDPGFTGNDCEIDIEVCGTLQNCSNRGQCTDGIGLNYTCFCDPGFQGPDCSIDGAHCNSTHCMNGGNCIEGIGQSVSCNCANGFTGDRCETDVVYCQQPSTNPCQNNATCIDGIGDVVTCICNVTYTTGNFCETIYCPDGYCQNGGNCSIMSDRAECMCPACFDGDFCQEDDDLCDDDTCQNGGTCIEGYGCEITCVCPPDYNGSNCMTPLCSDNSCQNGGNCSIVGSMRNCSCPVGFSGDVCQSVVCVQNVSCANEGNCTVVNNTITCDCPPGFSGSSCLTDIDVCPDMPCLNGGTCTEGLGLSFHCECPDHFGGLTCELPLPCSPNPCQNGGNCTAGDGSAYSCSCPENFSGQNCESMIFTNCTSDSDCSNTTYCYYRCSSDNYPSHSSLLTEPIALDGVSFENVPRTKFPTFTNSFTLFGVFNQTRNNRGYLMFYGTSSIARNYAVFLDHNNSVIWFYYTNTTGGARNFSISATWSHDTEHQIVVTFDHNTNIANFYLNGALLPSGVKTLVSPNFNYGVSTSTPASLFIGARLPRHFRFVGVIHQIAFFQEVLNATFITQLYREYNSLVEPEGECVSYLETGATCPEPTVAPSAICQSSVNKCPPYSRCLPNVTYDYTCQPQPLTCTVSTDCTSSYFCSNGTIPDSNSNYFQNPSVTLPGQHMFLQDNTMVFNGENFATLPASKHPDLTSDLTIFAVVRQTSGNDGYVVGKGINDRLRDFGLYLRSSRNTVWFAYGSDEDGQGFREILFFYNVMIADGNEHSIAAVIDSSANRAVLYIDGAAVAQQSPLPAVPAFRPEYNILYVGGRPRTKRFQFVGTIRNLVISTAAYQPDNIEQLHNDAFDGDNRIVVESPTVHYCVPYVSNRQICIIGDNSDFRCNANEVCVPEYTTNVARQVPLQSTGYRVLGRCLTPCDCDDTVSYECGLDGNTYLNSCQRTCMEVTKLHDGPCFNYAIAYAAANATLSGT